MATVACGIFRNEVRHLLGEAAERITWLPPGLHTDLEGLARELRGAVGEATHAVCLYGAGCHPDLDLLVGDRGRLPGKDCFAAFLTDDQRRELEQRRAFVMTPGWLRHWREIFVEGCGWDEVDARQNFGFYDSVVLLDFGLEAIDEMEILEFFEFTQTPVEVVPADLLRFRTQLSRLLDTDLGPSPSPNGE